MILARRSASIKLPWKLSIFLEQNNLIVKSTNSYGPRARRLAMANLLDNSKQAPNRLGRCFPEFCPPVCPWRRDSEPLSYSPLSACSIPRIWTLQIARGLSVYGWVFSAIRYSIARELVSWVPLSRLRTQLMDVIQLFHPVYTWPLRAQGPVYGNYDCRHAESR